MNIIKQKFTKNVASTLAVILVLSGLVFSISSMFDKPELAKAAWYNASWNYRQKIIIDHNKIPNTDQIDFPVLIKITDANNAVFLKAKDDGSDIRFTSSNQTTDLSFEVETFSKTTKELWAWVKIPTLSHDTDTTIYLYYGNASAAALSAASRQAVWSNGFTAVWHFAENGYTGVADEVKDSTSNALHGYASGSTTTEDSAIGNGALLDNRFIKIEKATLPVVSTVSFGMWIKKGTVPYAGSGTSGIMNTGDPYNSLEFQWLWDSGTMRTTLKTGSNQSSSADKTLSTWNDKYRYVQVTWQSGAAPLTYVDGVLATTGSAITGTIDLGGGWSKRFGLGAEWWHGAGGYNGANFNGYMDEPRLSSTARSADWIATEYANQNAPETFAYVASEVSQVTAPLQASPSGWYDMAWGSRQPVVFQGSKVPNTNQTDFPTLVKITDANNGLFDSAQGDGDDILFSDTSGNKLAHEIEKYDNVTHELWAWVKVPTLTTSTNTTIYMYYGNSSALSQQNKTAVWSNGYVGSWHLSEASGSVLNSASSSYNGTSAGSPTYSQSGKINKSMLFGAGADRYTNFGATPTAVPLTMSLWTKALSNGVDAGLVTRFSTAGYGYSLIKNSDNTFGIMYNNYLILKSDSAYNDTNWHHLAITGGADNSKNLYVDGALQSTTNTTWFVRGSDNANGYIAPISIQLGRYYDSYYDGKPANSYLDELSYQNVVRSADWIAAEYNNQNDPSTFELFGTAETADTFAPTNPSSVTGYLSSGGTLIANNSGTDSTPYYSWPEPEVAGGATDQTGAYISGVAGYYSYFGTSCGSGGADPALTRGVLGDTGGGLYYSSDVNVSVPDLTTNTGAYCLRLKTKDNAGNVSAAFEAATYNFDLTAPNAPTFIAANPAGYSSTDSFDFTWPVATDNTNGSGIAGYQYKRGNGTDDWSTTQTATSKTGILSYQTGANIFLVRSVDNAGNVSTEVQTTYYYSNSVPIKPTAVTATPAIDDLNSFAFSWTAPAHAREIVDYGYSINAVPTAQNLTWTGSASTTLAADAFATIQGDNTFYIVAKDEAGAYGVDVANYATATFNCTTVAPPIPTGVSITDSSNRTIDLWALTIKWSAGANQGASFDHYSIERSTDDISYSEIATTESLAYIDSNGLNNTTPYYYRVKAVDNANSPSAASTTVSKTPTGKYDSPPAVVTPPEAQVKASSATISWTVNRASTSAVRFGTSESDMTRVQINSTEETAHSVNLAGLAPATTYYYEVQSLDNFRDYTSESAFSSTYSLTTLPAPSIQELVFSSITISSAEVTFKTSTASATTISYGPTTSYGSILENTSATTLHTSKLTNLEPGTTYHLKITGTDLDSNSLVSDDYVFDTLPMPKISDLTVQPDYLGPNPGIKINWKTNVPTSSSVEYVPKQGNILEEKSKSALVSDHEIVLQGLTDSTSYRFYIYGTDQFGNTVRSDQNSLDTPLDSRPPKITDLNIESQSIGANQDSKAQIIVSWKTDEPATSQVEYGQGVSGDTYSSKTQKDAALSLSHTVIISNLDPSKTYHLKAVSEDKASNQTSSEDNAVITKKANESAFNIIISALSKAFGWLKIFN